MYTEYIVIDRTGYKDLIDTVEKFLQNGWTCQGGFHTYEIFGLLHYAQAMVK